MNIDTLTELRNLPWSGQTALNRTIVAQTATDYGPEQFEASLAAVVYEASRPMFIRNRFLPANATEEFYYQRIAQISDDVVVYQRIHGYQSNPLQNHICIVFKGTSTNYDYWTDFNILAEPLTGTSVFQQQIDSTVLNLTGMLSGLTLTGNTVSFIGHSLGFHKSECVLYKLLENNVINPAITTVLQYGFAPLVWNDSNHQLITLAVAQIVSGNTAYSKYSPLANNTSIYCIEGDYVSLLQKVDWVGYGTTYTRPNVSNTLISSTIDFYTNGVLTESINHTIGNWIDGVDKFPEVVEETPLESSTDHTSTSYLTTGNDWFITNALHVSFSSYNHHLSLEADSLGSNISVNIYHDSDPDDLQYKWTLTKDSSIANSIIYTDFGSHYIAFQYTVANTASGFTRTVRFRKDSHVPSGTTRDYYLIEDATQGLYFQIKANPTETTVDHLAGWDLSAPLPSLSTYNNYSSTDDKERTLWYLSHFTNDRQRETAWIDPQDGLRRHLYPVSLSPYVPPQFSSGTYASLPFEVWPTKDGVLDIQVGIRFKIESVKYPGKFLRFHPAYAAQVFHNSVYGYWTNNRYRVQNYDANSPNDFTWYMNTRSTGPLFCLGAPGAATEPNGVNQGWHGSPHHSIVQANGQSDIFCIDTDWNQNQSSNSSGIGLLYIVPNLTLAYPYSLEAGNIPDSTNANVNNVPLEAQFKIIWN